MGYSTKRLWEAASTSPIDWPTIFGERLTLEREAKTSDQREAADALRRATERNLHRAITQIDVAFASPLIYDEQGWPKRNPNYQAPKKR